MSIIIEKDDAVAANRRVPCRIFLSDGTSPDTGALNDAVVMGTNSLATFSVNSTLRGVNANNGMYCIELTASEVSKVGAHPLYHTVGDFCQHIATICVVQSNPYSTMSNYDPAPVWNASRSSFTGPTTMGMSQQIISSRTCGNVGDINHIRLSSNETGQDDAYNGMGISVMMRSGFWQMNVISDYTGSNNSAWCRESWLSIPRSGDTYIIWPQVDWKNISVQTLYASASTASSYLAPINHSGASVEILTGGIQTTSVGKGSYSGVSVEVKTGGIQVASVGVGSYSGVSVEVKTGGIQAASFGAGSYSGVTIQGILDASAVWNASRSSYTNPITFGMSNQIISALTCSNVGDANHIRLSSAESNQDDAYNGMGIQVMMRSGFWQTNVISDYTGSNNSAWCRSSWLSIPRSGDTYIIYPFVDWKNISIQTWYASASTASVVLQPIVHSGASVEVKTGGIQTTSIGAGNYSGMSVEVKSGGIQTSSIGAGNYSGMSVEVKAKGIAVASIETVAIYSALTIGGVDNITPRVYSGVSVEVKAGGIQTTSIGVGSYSGVSVEVKTGGIQVASIAAGAYSGRSFEVTTGGIQTVSVGKGNYSGVSQEILTGGIQTTSVGVGNYSGVSVEVKSSGLVAGSIGAAAITSAKFAASAIDAAALATDATVEIADALLGRNIAGGSSTGRTVSEALYPLRNRSLIEGSVLTVYTVDDVTSSWTATVSTGTLPIAGIDPLGP